MRKRYHSFSHHDAIKRVSPAQIKEPVRPRIKKRRIWFYVTAVLLVALGVLTWYLGSSAISSANNIFSSNISFKDIISRSELEQTDGVTNILILGRDQAAQLTDSIQIVRIRQKDKKVAMVSIPRDFQVKIPGDGIEKINAVYKIGVASQKDDKKKVGSGVKLASKTIEQISGVPIHYYMTADFAGLKDAVDILGGITIDVKNSFSDPEYPKDYFTKDGKYVKTNGYETFSVKAGKQKMDGITALKYARSRHGTSGEGSDFARAARQQQIIMAIRDKALSIGVLSNPAKISSLLESIGNSVKTDLTLSELKEAIDLIKDVDQTQIISKVLSNDPSDGLLVSVDEGGYYLIPKAGRTDYSQIQAMVRNIFADDNNVIQASVEVYNGSGVTGLGGKIAEKLKSLGLEVTDIQTNEKEIDQTIIYSAVSESAQIDKIKSVLGSSKIEKYEKKDTIKIIIGHDYGK